MTRQGIDYSWARPGGAAIKAAGFAFAMRYVPYPGDGGKGLEAGELEDLRSHGIAVGLVYESTAGRMLDGWAAGANDAAQCALAAARLGFPDDRPVYFACDFDAQPDQYPALIDYLQGAGSVLAAGRVGVYGSYAVVRAMSEAGCAPWSWQTYAWSRGQQFAGNHVYQYQNGQQLNGGAVDYCEAYGDDFGQWPVESEAEMTRDEIKALITEVVGADFPEYLEAYFAGKFTERNGVVSETNPEGKGPIKPWIDDIAARVRTVPGVAWDGGNQ